MHWHGLEVTPSPLGSPVVGESLKLCGGEKALDVHRPEISTCPGREQPTGDAWLLGKLHKLWKKPAWLVQHRSQFVCLVARLVWFSLLFKGWKATVWPPWTLEVMWEHLLGLRYPVILKHSGNSCQMKQTLRCCASALPQSAEIPEPEPC